MTKRTNSTNHGKVSRIGQLIGNAFEIAVIDFLKSYLSTKHPNYVILSPTKGRELIKLEMHGGSPRQLDIVLVPKDSLDPVALLETKWLKDARHWNDKGAWILQLREIKMKHATVRGAVAILSGYWKEGVGILLQNEGGIQMVMVATDEEVYHTLQPFLDQHLGNDTFQLEAKEIRQRFPSQQIGPFYDCLVALEASGQLREVAQTWLNFNRVTKDRSVFKGSMMIEQAINELLSPLPEYPSVQNFEISLQIDTGNIIHETFADLEDLLNFIQDHSQNPTKILDRIRPRKETDS